jgi:putative Mg2+ transporter-C (MgtC) family protein
MQDLFEWEDLIKAGYAVVAGVALGLERELKDKQAGLKTISIICLGATLFSIMSYKIGGEGNATQIAAYVVSGVGFIGAGAIFKDGLTVSGLTTAGIVWLAAAIGTSIGFGQYYKAFIFLAASMMVVMVLPLIIAWFARTKESVQIAVVFKDKDIAPHQALVALLQQQSASLLVKTIGFENGALQATYILLLNNTGKEEIYAQVTKNPDIVQFKIY